MYQYMVHLLEYCVKPIGIIKTPFTSSEGVPIQSSKSDIQGEILVKPEYASGLDSLALFSHIILLYWFHKAKSAQMKVIPYLDTIERGVFSTRAPSRPNPIGLSIVQLVSISDSSIIFRGADMLDETPLIDIKPYVPDFDSRLNASSGWLSQSIKTEDQSYVADLRFHE